MRYLLDTNVLSEIRKTHCDPNVIAWFRSISVLQCYISVITLGEIRRGIEKRRLSDERYAEIFETWLSELERQYGDRILSFDKIVADQWGRLIATNPAHSVDLQIAATARVHRCVMVTRNVRHFESLVPDILNPFAEKKVG